MGPSKNERSHQFKPLLPFAWAKPVLISDTYGVDIQGGEDEVLLLASTVVIDMVCHGDHKNS